MISRKKEFPKQKMHGAIVFDLSVYTPDGTFLFLSPLVQILQGQTKTFCVLHRPPL